MKKLFTAFALSAAVLSVAAVFGSCRKEESGRRHYTLKMSTQLNNTSPMVAGFREWARIMEEKSGGRMKIEVYTSASLGSDEDVIELALLGVNVAVLTDGGRMSNYAREIGIIGMAYIADSYEELCRITESPAFAEWDEKLVDKKMRILSYNWYDGPRNFYTNKIVESPADLKGLRIRTPGAPVWSRSVASLGATPIAMPWTDSYNALQSKSIDGVEVQSTSGYPARMYEVVSHIAKTEHFQLANFIMVGERWFVTLPDDLKALLKEECDSAAAANAVQILDRAAEYEKLMEDKGMKINDVDKAPFREASEAAYEELGFLELRDRVWREIGKL